MSALIIISAAIFLVYMVAIIVRYGFPASVSDSFYLLPLKWNAAFTLFCVSVAMTFAPGMARKVARAAAVSLVRGTGVRRCGREVPG